VIEHLAARRRWLGKQYPSSSASSARAIRTSLDVGDSWTDHAQVMTFKLTTSLGEDGPAVARLCEANGTCSRVSRAPRSAQPRPANCSALGRESLPRACAAGCYSPARFYARLRCSGWINAARLATLGAPAFARSPLPVARRRWMKPPFRARWFAALRRRRRRNTSASASRCSTSCAFPRCASAAAASTTALTSTPGWTTISSEGGPERRLNGP
jgi:hypothetical protein